VKTICATLGRILANTSLLYTKTQNYHWNIEDPRFIALHKMLEEQYESLSGFVDEFAERIRMLGEKSPATMKEWLQLGTIQEGKSNLSGDEMLRDLAESHESAGVALREGVREAESLGDPGTADLMIEALRDHEETAWFLRSHLK